MTKGRKTERKKGRERKERRRELKKGVIRMMRKETRGGLREREGEGKRRGKRKVVMDPVIFIPHRSRSEFMNMIFFPSWFAF